MADACAASGVAAGPRAGHPGTWVGGADGPARKIGAIGIRVARGVSFHGIALNVTTDLADFDLIDPCGLPGLRSTSLARERARIAAPRATARDGGDVRATARDARRPRASPGGRRLRSGARAPARQAARRRAPAGRRPGGRTTDPRGARRRVAEPALMSAGLFELRKDAITGWWVATLVDREFAPDRFAVAAEPVDDSGTCQNCRLPRRRRPDPDPQGLRVPHRRHRGGRPRDRAERRADRHGPGAGRGQLAHDHRPARRAPPAPLRRDGADRGAAGAARDAVADARQVGQTAYLQVLQNWGRQAGARTNHLCLDLYDLPQIPHEVAEEIGGAARFMIRESECPYCRAVRVERERSTRFLWEDARTVAFTPYASRSPFETWIVPRAHEADFGRSTAEDIRSIAEALRQVLGRLGLARRPAVQPRPPHRARRGRGRRDVPLALGDPPAPP